MGRPLWYLKLGRGSIEVSYNASFHANENITTPLLLKFAEKVAVDRPFYGVYYGQAALPMEPDAMYHLTNEVLEGCTVKCHDNGQTAKVFDKTRLESKDLYDVFLSGGAAVLEIRNPAGQPGKELIVFRDSFGSSPLPPPVSLTSQSHHEKPPEVTCTSRGKSGFPASTRERPRETFFNTSRGQIPLP